MNKMMENYGHLIIAELYDYDEAFTEDVELLRDLIKDKGKLNILECFCGTGRVFIPMALDGHKITGIDLSESMLERAKMKVKELNYEFKNKITLVNDDVVTSDWGYDYDLIIIGDNAFYELPNSDMQERCIEKAYKSLKKGGLLFISSDDYKGNWSQSDFSKENIVFEGKCENSYYGKYVRKDNRFDEEQNILYYTRRLYITDPDGNESVLEYEGQKHPVAKKDIEGWLNKYNFNTVKLFGDYDGSSYNEKSDKAIFLAEK